MTHAIEALFDREIRQAELDGETTKFISWLESLRNEVVTSSSMAVTFARIEGRQEMVRLMAPRQHETASVIRLMEQRLAKTQAALDRMEASAPERVGDEINRAAAKAARMSGMDQPKHRLHAARLSLEMAKRDMTSEQLADLCGVTPRTVRNWTAGLTKPGPEERKVLVGLFGKYDGEEWKP